MALFSLLSGHFFLSGIPESVVMAEAEYRLSIMHNEVSSLSILLPLAYVLLYIPAMIGLIFFKKWSLHLHALLIALMPLVTWKLRYSLDSWDTLLLDGWVSLGFGAALAIAWFSPLRSEFK